ncbi:MAG: M28 family peptidase [Candidatus Geothermincolia bacterium]
MIRRRKIWLVLTLVVGLAIGGAAGYFAQARFKSPKKTTAKSGAETTAPSSTPSTTNAQPAPADIERIRQVMAFLSTNIGARPAGKAGEKQAGSYLATELEKLGYKVGMEQFPMPNGLTSQNLVTADPGQSSLYTFFIVAHMDSRSGSPGANDNASGCAALLEVARTIKGTKHYPEIRFLVFGAEEENSSGSARVGSTYYLGTQPQPERTKIVGVLSMDTIAVGPELTYKDWGPASPPLADALAGYSQGKGLQATRLKGQESDHEPFGDAGIPGVWLERMMPGGKGDPKAHDSSDTMDHVFVNLVAESVNITRDYLMTLNASSCKSMQTAAYGVVPAPAPATTAPAKKK